MQGVTHPLDAKSAEPAPVRTPTSFAVTQLPTAPPEAALASSHLPDEINKLSSYENRNKQRRFFPQCGPPNKHLAGKKPDEFIGNGAAWRQYCAANKMAMIRQAGCRNKQQYQEVIDAGCSTLAEYEAKQAQVAANVQARVDD